MMAKGKVRLFFRNLKRVLLGRRGHTRSKQPPIEDRVVRRERRSQPRRDMDGAADRGSESLRRQRQSRCASKSVGSSLSSFEEDSWPLKSEHGTVKKEKGKKTSRLDGDARLTTIGDPNYSSSCEGERLPPNDTLLKGRICKSHSESSISPSEGSSGQARIEKGKGTAMIDGLQRTEDPRGWEYFKDSGNSSMEMGEARIEPSHDANDTSRTVAQAQGKWESFNDSKGSDRSEEGDNNVPVMQYTIPESSMDIRKVCFIGAGYVGKFKPFSRVLWQ